MMRRGWKRLFAEATSLITSDVCAIAVFSYVGVLARVKITGHLLSLRYLLYDREAMFDLLFYNSYFVPNIIGCFLIAIFQHQKSKVLQSAISPLYLSFYVGAITGFCGSLTTFSSWAFSIAVNMFDTGVLNSLVLMAIQLALLQSSLSLGISCCRLLDWVLIRPDVIEEEDRTSTPTPAIGEGDAIDSNALISGDSDQAAPDQTVCQLDDTQQRSHVEVQDGVRVSDGLRDENSIAVDPEPTVILLEEATPVAGDLTDGVRIRCRVEGESYGQRVFVLWFTLLVLTTTVIWTVIIVCSYYPLHDGRDQDNTIIANIDIDTLRSVALAPFGAVLRYSLWNVPLVTPYVTERVPGMKVPTLTANVLGTLFFSLSSSIAVNGPAALYTSAFNQGFCGSLTTASTFIMELHTLHRDGDGDGEGSGVHVFASMSYGLVTIVCGLLVSLFVLWGTQTPIP